MECVLNSNFGDEDDNTDSDCNTDDEECVDILNDSQHGTFDNLSTKDSNCNTISGDNKFSIDRILGINNNEDDMCNKTDKNSDECGKSVHFVKPTPLQAAQRNGIINYFN